MRILFFIVHPAKFRLFKDTVNILKSRGHEVDWAIVTKDTLEDFVKSEGWSYTNIFPEGRRIKGIPVVLATVINMFRTLFRLFKLTKNKKYDLFITSDILSFVGWVKRVPTLVFQDDDFSVVPEYSLIWFFATKVLAPHTCNLGPLNYKKLGYKGSHKWAYCNPKYFKPDVSFVKKFNPKMKRYFLIRLVSLTASHDRGKKGLDNKMVRKLVRTLSKKGKVYILSERELPKEFESMRLKLEPIHHLHAMYYADMFIGDSQSMISEAGLLGTPAIRFNDFAGKIGYLKEEESYGLSYSFKTTQGKEMLEKVEELLKTKDLKKEWRKRVDTYAKDHIDVTKFYVDVIESYAKK
ncbi:MAG TPA: hypothetical protein PLV59_02800 [Candidatus Dojkabacteria bacterium]|nr:hypothetical protein [Candidatus Dojkabacteria bacterium]